MGFVKEWHSIQKDVHRLAREKGWYPEKRNSGEQIALIHSELSEALEALRKGNPVSRHLCDPSISDSDLFSEAEEELADVVIRIMDLAEYRGWLIAEAIEAKHNYNKKRPQRHGDKLF